MWSMRKDFCSVPHIQLLRTCSALHLQQRLNSCDQRFMVMDDQACTLLIFSSPLGLSFCSFLPLFFGSSTNALMVLGWVFVGIDLSRVSGRRLNFCGFITNGRLAPTPTPRPQNAWPLLPPYCNMCRIYFSHRLF